MIDVHYGSLRFRKKFKKLRNEMWCVYYPFEGKTYHTVVSAITIEAACDRFDRENPHVKCHRQKGGTDAKPETS